MLVFKRTFTVEVNILDDETKVLYAKQLNNEKKTVCDKQVYKLNESAVATKTALPLFVFFLNR